MSETPNDRHENPTGNFNEDFASSLMQARAEQVKLEQEKANFETQAMQKLFEKYPEELRKDAASYGGFEIIACGNEPTPEQMQMIETALQKIREKLGEAADKAFAGVKIYLAADVVSGGGQAFGRESAVILDPNKMGMTVGQMEDMLDKTGQYRKGDRSRLVGDDRIAGELDLVHELGHILEFRAHGDYDVGLKRLKQEDSPTMYGQQSAREDYAESWMYYVYDGQLDDDRKKVIEADVQTASKRVNS